MEELDPQFPFDVVEDVTQTGLGIAQLFGGPGEVSQLGDAEDGFVLSQGDASFLDRNVLGLV